MRYVKYMRSSYDYASRNKREVSVLQSFQDLEIIVVNSYCNLNVAELKNLKIINLEKKLSRYSLIRKIQILYRILLREQFVLRSLKPDIISCHDLTALFIGWLSTIGKLKKNKPSLIYDSHEFEIGRNIEGKANRLNKLLIAKLESFLIKKSAFSIVVSNSISDKIVQNYSLLTSPIVVRNIPEYWNIDPQISRVRRSELCNMLGVNTDSFLLMYHGDITFNRGIEKLLEVANINPNIFIIILGSGKSTYVDYIRNEIVNLQISKRVLILGAVPHSKLWEYISAVDCGAMLPRNSGQSYYLSLPNKLFETIQSLTPIISCNFPEFVKIINGYNIGICVDSNSTKDINEAIELMRTNKIKYSIYKKNLIKAKNELHWENESKILKNEYAKLIGRLVKSSESKKRNF